MEPGSSRVQSSSSAATPVGHRGDDVDVLAPDGSQIRLLIDQRHFASQASLCEVSLEAGQVSRPVWHRRVEEVWYVLEGRGEVWRCPLDVDPSSVAPVDVEPGDSLAIPPLWRFQFRALGNGPLRFLCFTTPPWPGPDEAQPSEYGGLGPSTV